MQTDVLCTIPVVGQQCSDTICRSLGTGVVENRPPLAVSQVHSVLTAVQNGLEGKK